MLGICSFLRGLLKMLTKLTKKSYRTCALVMTGTVVIAAAAFNSGGFNGGGKNKITASRNAITSDEIPESISENEDTEGQAKIQAEIDKVLEGEEISQISLVEKAVVKVKARMEKEEISTETIEDEGETMPVISLSEPDYEALLRIVEAEATGEDTRGKILVGNVIMNRVNHSEFPDTVVEVVFQREGGSVQFSPVADGRYESVTISDDTLYAVDCILEGEDYSEGALFFSARDKADPSNMRWFDSNLKWLFEYGGHEFYTLKR